MKAKIVFVAVLLISTAFISNWCAKLTYKTDFSSFYRAAYIALDQSKPISDIYRTDDKDFAQYNIPENEGVIEYRYSVLATYLISPLALLDYYSAKTAMLFINIISFAISVILILWANGARGRRFLYPLALSFLWMPFIQNIRFAQTNGLIFLLITVAVILAANERYYAGGLAMAVSTLFKPFTLPVTMVLCVKDWRMSIGYLISIISALFLPGTREWLHSYLWPPHAYYAYSYLYRTLVSFGDYLFWLCALTFGAITAFITYKNRHLDFFAIASLAIPAAFLAMPVLETTHLTVLIFSLIYLSIQELSIFSRILAVISFVLINAGSINCLWAGSIMYLGIFSFWITMIYVITKDSSYRMAADISVNKKALPDFTIVEA